MCASELCTVVRIASVIAVIAVIATKEYHEAGHNHLFIDLYLI
jgi:hypothetical protein